MIVTLHASTLMDASLGEAPFPEMAYLGGRVVLMSANVHGGLQPLELGAGHTIR